MSPGSSRRAGGFSLVLRPTTTGGSFWEFDCFTVQKRSSFGTQSSPRRTFLAGRRSGRLEGRFPPARLLLPGGSQDNWRDGGKVGNLLLVFHALHQSAISCP